MLCGEEGRMTRTGSALLVLALCTASATASISMPSLFSDHMVLQRDVPLRIWGWGTPGGYAYAALYRAGAGQVSFDHSVLIGADGNWEIVLPPAKAGTGYTLAINELSSPDGDNNPIQFKDVAVGDVWVGSGQSNMEMSVASSANAKEEIAAANYPNIRLFTVPRRSTEHPLADAYGTWATCSPATVGNFSAVSYFFGRELMRNVNVPIGLIHSSWGGTPAEAWTPRSWIRKNNILGDRLAAYLDGVKTYPARRAAFDAEMAAWNAKPAAERGAQPRAPGGAPRQGNSPSGLYQGMIAPLVKFPVRGVIWYQGESNAGEPELYSELFPMMITSWRAAWNRPQLPFYFVQLANFETGFNWAWVREAQMAALKLGHTGAAMAIDVGEARDIHPKNKQEVGRRLALQALADAYLKPVMANGPTYAAVKFVGDAARVSFANAKGLMYRGGAPTSLEVAGEDRKFVPATSTVEGEVLVVRAPAVSKPVAVRYAWASNPAANLYNGAGLPAIPFRTDNWPR